MIDIQKVLLYGATGDQGELQLAQLPRRGYQVRAALRHPEPSHSRFADVAEYRVKALESPPAWNRSFVVGGPEVLVGDEVAERLSHGMGKAIRFQSITPDQFARTMSRLVTGRDEVAPESIWDRMGQFYRWYNAQAVSPLAVNIEPLLEALPIQPTPFVQWAKLQDWSL